MSLTQILLIILAFAVAIIVYVLLRKADLKLKHKKWIRIILFASMISYLVVDFYIKQKYGLLFVLGLGSIAFIYMVLRSKDN